MAQLVENENDHEKENDWRTEPKNTLAPSMRSGIVSRDMTLPARRAPLAQALAVIAAVFSLALPLAAQTPAPAASSPAAAPAVENAVVKIFSTMRSPDPYKPWTKQSPREGTGTGVIIEGKRILTNAHVVLYSSQVQVQGHQSGDKIPATVEFIAPGIDLAILKLEDETFFDTRPPLPRANKLPAIKDNVLAYGYPTGGTSLSITKGIVSRIEFANYNYPVSGLRIQIDAAINPGNSGGPALSGDEMIGIAFSRLGGGDNIGYIIPNEEVELFLADVKDGKYDGKPAMFDELQSLENPALRSFLKLGKDVEGIVVHRTDTSAGTYPLKEWDVISRIGDTPVDNEGMIKLGENLRVRFQYQIQRIAKDGKVPLTIVRQQKEQKIDLPVSVARELLIPDLDGAYPSYFIYGPLVFSVGTNQFLAPLGGNARAQATLAFVGSPLATRRGDSPAFPGEELVVVSSPFFPHRLSKGYDNPISRVVESINGTKVKNLRHTVEVLRDLKDEFVTIEFVGRGAESVVFVRKEMISATEEILNDNGVRSQGSPELMDVWEKK